MSKPLRILLVEDDPEDAVIFRRHCPALARVQHVTDGPAALEALRGNTFDICFTDYRLGPESGLDVIRKMRSVGLRVPIVVITGQDVETLGENALLAGATDFMPKDDINAQTLQRVIRWSLIRRLVETRREDGQST